MTRVRAALLVLLLPWLAAQGVQAEEAPTPEAAAAAVVAAVRADDDAALAALLARDVPDPWRVGEVLLAKGLRPEALRWARSAERPAVRGLPTALEAEPTGSAWAADGAALARAEAALAADDPAAALRALEDRPAAKQGLRSVRLHALRGRARVAQGYAAQDAAARVAAFETAAAAHRAAADEAERLGWLTRASDEVYAAGLALWQIDSGDLTARLVALFERQRGIEERLGSDIGVGRAHFRIATALWTTGAYGRIETHLAAAERSLAKTADGEYLAKVLSLRANLLDGRGQMAAALTAARRAATALGAVDGSQVPARFRPDEQRLARSRAEILLDCASYALRVGEEAPAQAYGAQAAEAAASVEDPYLRESTRAFLLVLQGVRQDYGGAPLEALASWEEARGLYVALGRQGAAADLDLRIGGVLADVGDALSARERVESAIRVLHSLGARSQEAWARLRAAVLRREAGQIQDAAVLLDAAGSLAEALGDPALRCEIGIERARGSETRGDFAEALLRVSQAGRIAEQAGLPERLALARTYEARLQMRLGDTEASRTLLAAATKGLKAAGRTANLRKALSEEALLRTQLGDHAAAQQTLATLVPIYEAADDKMGLAVCHRLWGESLTAQRKFAPAVVHYEQALSLQQSMQRPLAAVQARIDLADIRHLAGGGRAVLPELLAAQKEAEALGSPEVRASAAKVLAAVYSAEGQPAEAMTWARRALDEVTDFGLDLPEGDDAALRGTYAPLYDLGARAALELNDAAGLFHFLERGRASTLVAALGGMQAMRQAKVPPALRADEEQARGAVVMAQAKQRRAQGRKASLLKKEVEVAQEKLAAALDAIRLAVHMQADLAYASVPAVETLCGEVSENEALVLYAQVGKRIVALVVDCEQARVKDLGPAEEVEAAVATGLRALIDDPKDENRDAYVAPQGALRTLLVEALPLGKKITRLIVSPGEALAFVPFGALAADHEVVLIQSTATLLALRKVPASLGTQVLALGDPDYAPYRRLGQRMPQLGSSGGEVRAITKDALTGKQASETNFYKSLRTKDGQAVRPWRGIHLACHGLVDVSRPLASRLALSVGGGNDGLLETREVFQLELAADLVVLSGCETSKAQVIAGDGLSGLVRAFMQAGAPRVICSLWKVDDESTGELMKAFYRYWNAEDPKQRLAAPAALRAAQKHVREYRTTAGLQKWKHPKYWAAWVLWGVAN